MDLHCFFVCLVAVLLGFRVCYAQDTNVSNSSTSKKIYCGQHLSRTLSVVCKGIYNTLNKKSDIYRQRNDYSWDAQYSSDVQYPFRNKASATSLITNFHRRKRRGVFNECCQKPCSEEELSSYCGSRRK